MMTWKVFIETLRGCTVRLKRRQSERLEIGKNLKLLQNIPACYGLYAKCHHGTYEEDEDN